MIFLIILICIIIIALVVFAFFAVRKKKYSSFIIKNSISLDKVMEINKKYNFYPYISFNESHTYDNESFFGNISCEDYLIYQLQYKKKEVEKEIKNMRDNFRNFELYISEIKSVVSFGKYKVETQRLNINYLNKLEEKMIDDIILNPAVRLEITIVLYLSKINGRIYARKIDRFNSDQILSLIGRINNKNGTFYNDRGIWDSICRVERGKVSNKMRFSIYERDGYRCRYCGRSGRFYDLEIDHIKPIAKGGKSTYDNLQTLCKRCNKEKGDKY